MILNDFKNSLGILLKLQKTNLIYKYTKYYCIRKNKTIATAFNHSLKRNMELTVHCQISQSYTGEHKKNKPSLHELLLHEYFCRQTLTAECQGLPERVMKIIININP